MNIGVDLDDVLTDFVSAVCAYHNATYGTALTRDNFFSSNYWEVWGGTKEEAIQKMYNFHATPYFLQLEPLPGAKESLVELKKKGDLTLITARQDSIAEVTKDWLKKFFPGIFSGAYFVNHHSKQGKQRTKKEVCDALGIDVLIDDTLENAFGCLSPERKIFLPDCPWNRQTVLPPGITRVQGWLEILAAI